MHLATLLLLILAAGLTSQWLAWLIRLPAIVILIASGLVLGPVTGVIDFALAPEELAGLISMGVAIILFDGGMALKLGEFRRVGHGILRLTTLGPVLTWWLGALAAHFVAGLSWPVAIVLGAILVVTGPTVILPLLRQARLNSKSASLLKWEGIVNDPVGVLLAVLSFQYFTLHGEAGVDVLLGLGKAIAVAAVLGGVGGWLTGWFYRRGAVPSHLKPPILMVLVLAAFWASDLVQHEAGLLTVTVMGLVLGNMRLVERVPLRNFKENLTVVLLSALFIVIPTQLEPAHLELMDWRIIGFVLAVLFLVRPLSVLISTLGAPMRGSDKVLLAWIAPRGIVAAATASIFGPAMVAAGYPEAEILMPLVFLIILVTVVIHGITLGPVARHLELAADEENGLLIVGASDWTRALAAELQRHKIDVIVADGSWHRLKPLRMDGISTFYGEVLSEHGEYDLDDEHLSYLLCATDNDYYNALVCKALGHEFGHHRTFQLAPAKEPSDEQRRLTLQQRGYFSFEPPIDSLTLHERLHAGWTMQSTPLSKDFDLERLEQRLGPVGEQWVLIGSISTAGRFRMYSREQSFDPGEGSRLLYFAPGDE